jgi:hypothetical protein
MTVLIDISTAPAAVTASHDRKLELADAAACDPGRSSVDYHPP